MKIEEIMKAAHYRITGSDNFMWQCYGQHAKFMDFDNGDNDYGISCVFDTADQTVYEVGVYSKDGKCYRWINENFVDNVKNECVVRQQDFTQAIDDTKWVDLEYTEDLFRKISQVMDTGICDNEVTMTFDLDEDLLMQLFFLAHEKDITFNELMKEVLQGAIEKAKTIVASHKEIEGHE